MTALRSLEIDVFNVGPPHCYILKTPTFVISILTKIKNNAWPPSRLFPLWLEKLIKQGNEIVWPKTTVVSTFKFSVR
jgi:hypothetical protein